MQKIDNKREIYRSRIKEGDRKKEGEKEEEWTHVVSWMKGWLNVDNNHVSRSRIMSSGSNQLK